VLDIVSCVAIKPPDVVVNDDCGASDNLFKTLIDSWFPQPSLHSSAKIMSNFKLVCGL
jgi:hypothetical protein